MQKIGYLFPGQGAQYVGMGLDLYEKYPIAREIFDKANAVLDFDLKKVCFEGPKEELNRTDISQPAILTVSIAALMALEESWAHKSTSAQEHKIAVAAGLSLGEYSALVSAGVVAFEDAVKVVAKRGKFMQDAAQKNKGTMASVIGLSKDAVLRICKDASVQIANLNCPCQIVISGLIDNMAQATELAKKEGAARVIPLDVSGPFHSQYMQSAGKRLQKELEGINMSSPRFPVIANRTADYQHSIDDIKRNLIGQVSSPVLWEDSMRLMLKDGITTFLEIGPGAVLKGLARRIDNNIKVYNIGKAKEIEGFTGQSLRGLLCY